MSSVYTGVCDPYVTPSVRNFIRLCAVVMLFSLMCVRWTGEHCERHCESTDERGGREIPCKDRR